MVVQLEEAVGIYRRLSRFPAVKLGTISNADIASHIQVNSVWTQRNLEKNELMKFSRGHVFQLDIIVTTPSYEICNEQWNKQSISGRYRAVVRKWTDGKGVEKQFLEVWSAAHQLQNIDISNLDRHGKIYEDGQFGCLEWSHSETHLLYVAEKKFPKTKSFFDTKSNETAGDTSGSQVPKGDEFLYKNSWGEQLNDKYHSVLCVLDIEAGCVSLLENVPDDVSPGQAVWCPDDLGVVCVGWKHVPYRLGLIYCLNRRSTLYHIDLKSFTCNVLGPADRSVRSPIFSPDFTKLLYLDNPAGGPHAQCSRLMMCDWSTKGIVPVVDIIQDAPADEFQGIFTSRLPSRCWASDSKRIVLDVAWRSKNELVVINSESGKIARLTDDDHIGSWTLLDVRNDLILAACSSLNQPEYLVVGQLPTADMEDLIKIKWTRLDSDPHALEDISWKIVPVNVGPKNDTTDTSECVEYEYMLMTPVGHIKPPLVVYLHGGPHSVVTAMYQIYLAAMCQCGYAVLIVNYRGSYGFGQKCIDSLLGNIGIQDVQDVQRVVEELVRTDVVDKDRIVVIGGSHGGFLATHLIGQYADFYKAAVARNPVINLATMIGNSDIPDWVFVESGFKYDQRSTITDKMFTEFYKRSPIALVDQIKTPLLLMLGGKDLRVPPSQGLEIRKELEARNRSVRTLWYPDSSHPISEINAEADAFMNIIRWFNDHIANASEASVQK